MLCYHGVSLDDEHEWDPELYMSRGSFEGRLKLLQRGGYAVLSLAEGLSRLRDGTLPDGAVALTFDDGPADFYSVVHPLLQQYGMPATVYVTTYYSEFQRPVFGVFCSYVLWRGRHRTLDLAPLIPGESAYMLAAPPVRALVQSKLQAHATTASLDASAKDDLARRLSAELGVDYEGLARTRLLHIMSPDELRQLSRAGVDLQLHTHRHRAPKDRALFLREIEDNRSRLEAITGRTPTHFCYPSGVYHAAMLPWLREAGVASAVTCDPGLAHRGTDPLLVPRVVDTERKSPLDIEAWVSGARALLPVRSRWVYANREESGGRRQETDREESGGRRQETD